MSDWATYLQANDERFLQELVDFLRIPSISAIPEHAPDVQRAGQWLADHLRGIGFTDAQVMPTGGHPVVYASWMGAPGKPIALVYGHFDVQPVDPLGLWDTPPFEPTVRDGRLYARGASDNKGNIMIAVNAIEALLRTTGALPVNVKLFFEGQEEIGSPQQPDFIPAHRDLLACDFVLNADSGQFGEKEGALALGNRGITSLEFTLRGAKADLHSGGYGGAIQNPLHAMAELVASLHTPEGGVAVTGFYDGVRSLSDEERAAIGAVPHEDAQVLGEVGAQVLWGEPGYSTLERLWARPTLELNGMWGGFTGQGTKTVLPAEAHAKISCRLVPNQDPAQVQQAVIAHLEKHLPIGVSLHVSAAREGTRAYSVSADHPANVAVREVLTELYGKEPYHVRSGGSVPILTLFHEHLGVDSVGFGFALNDDQVHAPNERLRLSCLSTGRSAWCRLLQRLGQ